MKIDLKALLPFMGRKVKVEFILKRKQVWDSGKRGHRVTWEQVDLKGWGGKYRPRVGWFCGVRWLQEGFSHMSTGSGYDYDPGYMEVKNTVPVAMVCFWPTSKPVPVPILGCLPMDRGLKPEAPIQASWDSYKDYKKAGEKSWNG